MKTINLAAELLPDLEASDGTADPSAESKSAKSSELSDPEAGG